jgi:hypothetical protein
MSSRAPNIHIVLTHFADMMHHHSPAVLVPYVHRTFHSFPTVFASSHHAQSGVPLRADSRCRRDTATEGPGTGSDLGPPNFPWSPHLSGAG